MNGGVRLSKVLVVDDSAILRDMLRLCLAAHADRVLTATTAREGENRIAEHCDIDLVIAETLLPDGDGFRLLACVNSLEAPKPRVILTAVDASEEDADRALQMGAIGYLAKPIALRDVAAILKQHRGEWSGVRRPRRRSHGKACVLDRIRTATRQRSSPPQLFWYLRDVGETGAFLETESPIPVGTRFDLELEVGSAKVLVSAKVVRVQEPVWGNAGGVGVHFTDFGADARTYLNQYIEGETC
ncbi:MAG: response regulator [Myxococcales bacterium]|nr:response regulator [Myxococcales bacterium]MDH5565821.1 response regulator [Myxococcales bacterium]